MVWDGHLRIEKVKVEPYKKSGFSGTLVKKGPRWIDVESEQDQVPWRFCRWLVDYLNKNWKLS